MTRWLKIGGYLYGRNSRIFKQYRPDNTDLTRLNQFQWGNEIAVEKKIAFEKSSKGLGGKWQMQLNIITWREKIWSECIEKIGKMTPNGENCPNWCIYYVELKEHSGMIFFVKCSLRLIFSQTIKCKTWLSI